MARDTMPGLFAAADALDMFSTSATDPAMPNASSLRPATVDEIAETLSFALLYQAANECTMPTTCWRGSPLSGLSSTWRRRGSC